MVYNGFSFRQWTRWPGQTLLAAMRNRSMGGGARVSEEVRRAYDTDLAGAAAPETEFASVRVLRRAMTRFSNVTVYKENCDHVSIIGVAVLPRQLMLPIIGRTLGLDLYVHAVK